MVPRPKIDSVRLSTMRIGHCEHDVGLCVKSELDIAGTQATSSAHMQQRHLALYTNETCRMLQKRRRRGSSVRRMSFCVAPDCPAKPAVPMSVSLKVTGGTKASKDCGGTAGLLPAERAKASFDVPKLRRLLNGNETHQHELGALLVNDPLFDFTFGTQGAPHAGMSPVSHLHHSGTTHS